MSPRPPRFRRVALRYLAVAALVGGLAFVALRYGGPAAIRAAHAGRLPLVDRLLPGRGQVPVERYLDQWSALGASLAFMVAVALVVGFATLVLLWHTASTRRTAATPVGPLPAHRTLRYALWFAVWGGLGEGTYLIAKYLLFRGFPAHLPEVSTHAIWMTTVDHVLVALGVWGLLVGAGRAVPALRRSEPFAFAFPLLVLLAWFGTPGRIAPWAALLLGSGLCVQLVRRGPLRSEDLDLLMRRTLPVGVVLAGVAGLALPAARRWAEHDALAGLPAAPPGAPNVLLVVLDTQRASGMGLYGYPRPTTPHLDALAAESVVYDQAYSTAPWTLPSHASLFTARWPHELNVGFTEALDGTWPTLAETMAARGFVTGGFAGNNIFVNPLFGLARGFHRFEAIRLAPATVLKQSWLTRWPWLLLRKRLGTHDYVLETSAAQVTEWFLAWEAEGGPRPFFGFLNLMEPHEPYDAPTPFARRFAPDGGLTFFRRGVRSEDYSEAELRQLRDRYDEDVLATDAAVGALVDSLRTRGLLDHTVLIVTADHGEEFGEHGWLDHPNTIYRTTTQVPLLIRAAGLPAGLRIAEPVTLRDVASTVLALSGGDPAQMPGAPLDRFWVDRPTAVPGPILSELGHTRSVVQDGHRYLWYPDGREELFDLRTDPLEAHDLVRERPQVRAALLATLRSIYPDIGPDGKPGPGS